MSGSEIKGIKKRSVQNSYSFCMFCFVLLCVAYYIDRLANPPHCGIVAQMSEHTNKPPHPIEVLRPWVYVGVMP